MHRVSIHDMKFEPATLDVPAGDVVIWTNTDFVPHTATATDRGFDTGKLEGGESKRVVFTKKGAFGYFCRFHIAMKGSLTVH